MAIVPIGRLPQTDTAVATSIEVQANGFKIGRIQSFSPSQTRELERVRHLNVFNPGEIWDMVPGNVRGSISVTRLMLYTSRLLDLFKHPDELGMTLTDFRLPFDVEVWLQASDSDPLLLEKYEDCYVVQHNFTLSPTGALLIAEQATIEFRERSGSLLTGGIFLRPGSARREESDANRLRSSQNLNS